MHSEPPRPGRDCRSPGCGADGFCPAASWGVSLEPRDGIWTKRLSVIAGHCLPQALSASLGLLAFLTSKQDWKKQPSPILSPNYSACGFWGLPCAILELFWVFGQLIRKILARASVFYTSLLLVYCGFLSSGRCNYIYYIMCILYILCT